jgi:hypothetical protein
MQPRGLRNRNPGNLRASTPPWLGVIATDDGYAIFDTLRHGLRACALQLLAYQDRHGIRTVRAAITRWAPPADHNPTADYIATVCRALACEPDTHLDFHDPYLLRSLVKAIGSYENGREPFRRAVPDALIHDAVLQALDHHPADHAVHPAPSV